MGAGKAAVCMGGGAWPCKWEEYGRERVCECVYLLVRNSVFVFKCLFACVSLCVYFFLCVCVLTCKFLFVCLFLCVSLFICLYAPMYVLVYVN